MNRFLLVSLLLLSSCVSPAPLYRPDAHVMPFFEKGRSVQIAASIGGNSVYGAEVITSPVQHVIVFGRGMTTNTRRFRQRFWEAGAGVYFPVGTHVVVELLGGFGQGNPQGKGSREVRTADDKPVAELFSYQASYQRIYTQINVGAVVDNDDLMMGGAFRLTQAKYRDFHSVPTELFDTVVGIYLEPALIIRAPLYEALFLEGEIGTSFSLKRRNWALFETPRRYGSIGVRYQFGR